MTDNQAVLISTCITAFVTIIGFVITYSLGKRNLKDEIDKQRANVYLSQLSALPLRLQEWMKNLGSGKGNPSHDYNEIVSQIIAYGTSEMIRIVSYIQRIMLKSGKDTADVIDDYLVLMVLLLCQTKSDLTGTLLTPSDVYMTRFVGHDESKYSLLNNKYVRKLRLKRSLLMHS